LTQPRPLGQRTLIAVGGGVIGVEYACMLAALGVRVSMVEWRLLEFADTEMVEALETAAFKASIASTTRLTRRYPPCN
jgi:pyruvate/2-oxoglutarate dehydrogenase complex dihydrolipoamide dehydrogenase (E3) component